MHCVTDFKDKATQKRTHLFYFIYSYTSRARTLSRTTYIRDGAKMHTIIYTQSMIVNLNREVMNKLYSG